jgi:hypothetical protein
MAGFDFKARNFSIHRVPKNPMDKSTIISAYPKDLDELKPTLQPGRFFIPKGSKDDVSTTTIGPSSWFKELNPDEPILEIVESSVTIAASIIMDYCSGLLGCDMSTAMPAMFWVPGDFKKAEVKIKFASEIAEAIEKQKNWFKRLVDMADAFWIRSNGNPMSISEDMKLAATDLNLLDRPWLIDTQKYDLIKCPACGTLIGSNIIVCPNCKVILDEKKAAALKLTFAK